MLRKPARMRWDYSKPKGKLLVEDGKYLWLYTPNDNRVEKMKVQESDDMRAPLAFLLGKLHFDKEFRNLQAKPENGLTRITAEPKTDTLPYLQVEFVVSPDAVIHGLRVTYFDKSILEFSFEQEKMDLPLDTKLFQFQMPPGAHLEEAGQ
jgi:outer membrane lipoprotein carrier protein